MSALLIFTKRQNENLLLILLKFIGVSDKTYSKVCHKPYSIYRGPSCLFLRSRSDRSLGAKYVIQNVTLKFRKIFIYAGFKDCNNTCRYLKRIVYISLNLAEFTTCFIYYRGRIVSDDGTIVFSDCRKLKRKIFLK